MVKKFIALFTTAILLFGLCACTVRSGPASPEELSPEASQGPTWQEQYDLGVRYLSEGKYQEAILAFAAAIEIDPRRAPAYVGRGDAYVLSGETEENLTAAKTDYEKAIELDETIAEAYLGLADVYIRQGDYEKALEILREGLEKTGDNEKIADKIQEFVGGTILDRNGNTRKSCHYEDGELVQYWLYEYDEMGNNIKTTNYNADDTVSRVEISEFNDLRQKIRMTEISDNSTKRVETYEYDNDGRLVRTNRVRYTDGEEIQEYDLLYYDDIARTETTERYSEDGSLTYKFIVEKDEHGIRRKGLSYSLNENNELFLDYYVEYIWNDDGTYGGYNLVQVAEKSNDNY